MTAQGMICDLRSDTVTKPDRGMLRAMTLAEVGDDVFGEDPTVAKLEETVADMLGHEAGLFCVTGSLANMLAVRLLVSEGEEILCDAQAHIVRAELGGHAAFGAITTRTWPTTAPGGVPGEISPDLIGDMVSPRGNEFLVSTAAVSVENTHNFAGGAVQPVMLLRRLHHDMERQEIHVHLDGARLWNACAAVGASAHEYGKCATLVCVCLSKGLGAPAGSLLVGPAELIDRARLLRKRFGAGWRQAGVLAAAGLYALVS